jgi:hypothetical protein
VTVSGQTLVALELPYAPPVTTGTPAPLYRPKAPALGLFALGVLLVFGPIVGGMFAKTAAGNQMIGNFAPFMQSASLARDANDVHVLRAGAAGIDAVYQHQDIPSGAFPGLDEFRRDSGAIVGRAAGLLDRVQGAQGDYQQVAQIGGFDRLPFLMVAAGLVAIYGGGVLLAGRRSRARPAVALVVVASTALCVYPFASGLFGGAQAGQRMVHSLSPVMTVHEVRQLQEDFIVLVNVDGELSTTFRGLPRAGRPATAIATLVTRWPKVSSDLASLVGVINDNIGNFNALEDLDALLRDIGLPGLGAFPWVLVAIGAVTAGLAVAALPRRRKGPT